MDARGYRLGYRSDIEGLRAVGILLVVAAHAKVSWLAGGFVGVDVFFVLSGYLITGVLLREIEQTGQLRFANFYARRFRRLLPALLLMLVVTSVFAAVVLAPGEQGEQAIAAATASMWFSNIHFAFAKLDYFSPGAAGNLFLHTWSLGVEEQFYLVWPALLVSVLGVWRGNAGNAKGGSSRRLKIAMLTIGAASLLACAVMTQTAPQMAFYLMPSRAWQFATGALIWLYFGSASDGVASDQMQRLPATFYRWAGWLGLILIVASGLLFDAQMAYPGWHAWLPTMGAAAILMAGARGIDSGVSGVLSWRPLQAVGRISYSWYLWHWPVLLLGGALFVTQSPLYRAALVTLSLLLAVLSYRWVETPARRQARWIARPGMALSIALAIMVTANVFCMMWFNAASIWGNNPIQQRYAKAHTDTPLIYSMGCDDWFQSDKVRTCAFGPTGATHTAVLMGDSIGAQWFPAVAEVFDRADWRLLVLTKSSCPMLDRPIFYPRIGRDYVECTTWRRDALQQVAALRPDIVILGSVQTYDFNQSQWVEGTADLLKTISGAVGHIYLLRGTPGLPFNGPDCLSAQSSLAWLSMWQHSCHASAFSQQGNDVYLWLQQASKRFGNVSTLDMNNAVCPNGQCDAERDGEVVFRDSQHMTATFVRSLSGELGRRLLLSPEDSHAPAGQSSALPSASRRQIHDARMP
jgi:peptidoglycan/LPS O-acetylase OafA/YrhL